MVEPSLIRVSTKLNPLDRDALERCLRLARASIEPGVQGHVGRVLMQEGWLPAAELACNYCQSSALSLRPWQDPPCEIHPTDLRSILAAGDDGTANYRAAKLLQEMFRSDLSQYEPDPLAALEAAKKLPPAA